ncbi:hypothetical protein ABIA39_008880, partial [Nocardia sp. GAS34]
VAVLTQELRGLGYRGSERTVYRYLQPFRAGRSSNPVAELAYRRPPCSSRSSTGIQL